MDATCKARGTKHEVEAWQYQPIFERNQEIRFAEKFRHEADGVGVCV